MAFLAELDGNEETATYGGIADLPSIPRGLIWRRALTDLPVCRRAATPG